MTDTRTRILDLAEQLTQSQGFNGFSYLDLASAIGIKNSSIHYHFKAKSDLALALVERRREKNTLAWAEMDKLLDTPDERIVALINYFKNDLKSQRICMCGMMAAELQSISPDVRRMLTLYFRDFQNWLSKQFSAMGHANPPQAALQFLSTLEGVLLLARLEGDISIVNQALDDFVNA